MAWSSYAHLPTKEKEYWNILSKLKNGMNIIEVDHIIAEEKGKDKVQHHYRSNLANIGLLYIIKNAVYLNYDVEKLASNKSYLKEILTSAIYANKSSEIEEVMRLIYKLKTYELNLIIEKLLEEYPLVEKNNFIRWVRPIVNLFELVDILSEKNHGKISSVEKYLQEAYFRLTDSFGNAVALELMEKEIKKTESSFDVIVLLDSVLAKPHFKFKIELLMMPAWATKNKIYKINQDRYTHIKIKTSLFEEDKK